MNTSGNNFSCFIVKDINTIGIIFQGRCLAPSCYTVIIVVSRALFAFLNLTQISIGPAHHIHFFVSCFAPLAIFIEVVLVLIHVSGLGFIFLTFFGFAPAVSILFNIVRFLPGVVLANVVETIVFRLFVYVLLDDTLAVFVAAAQTINVIPEVIQVLFKARHIENIPLFQVLTNLIGIEIGSPISHCKLVAVGIVPLAIGGDVGANRFNQGGNILISQITHHEQGHSKERCVRIVII